MGWLKDKIQDYKRYREYLDMIKDSPFISPKKKIYLGKKYIGTPYSYPRYWDKKGECHYKKIALDFTSLGWKPKYDMYRFEWCPGWTIIFFDWQLYINNSIYNTFSPFGSIEDDCLWEGFLTWKYDTPVKLSHEDRFIELIKKWGCTWGNSDKGYIDYMYKILKPEYIDIYNKNKDLINEID